ncbi:cytochrome P-450 like protein [Ktedonobacter robiniae]|uniref:Cytochrome P-450 like protein n=2 Tax=Ktedonobacter robiniae TaxID=2778365 RepID=A0ABQ3UYZ9_9CHLR|nr:cytochrome P-450 like protein [Ktedonobacter robiniae]
MQGAILQEPPWSELRPLFSSISNLMFYADPPKHSHMRSLINKAMSARMVERWREHIQSIVNAQIDQVIEQGKLDIIADIAFPLPMQVIADMLGVPVHERQQFKRWSDDLADFLGNPPTLELCQRLFQSIKDFTHYFRGVVAEHKANPKDDLVDALLQHYGRDGSLTEEELLMNCVGLFTGGHETTTNAIGNGLLALLHNMDELQKLRDNPALLTSTIEECLRYDSPVQFTARFARQTTEIGGKKIYKGQSVMLMLGAANRDPAVFNAPDTFDISRQDNRHLAFGQNIHYCIGAPIARLEMHVLFETLLRRLPDLRLADEELTWHENLSFHGVKRLPVLF